MSNDKKLSTYPLDDAMKELLDLFNQCNDKTSQQKQQSSKNIDLTNHEQDFMRESSVSEISQMYLPKMTECNDKISKTKENDDSAPSVQNDRGLGSRFDGNETIEMLQQRQSELQDQLDEILKVAKELELKQKNKLNGLIQDNMSGQHTESDDGEDDIELIEFHQIEIELRISELNRQLSNIQEELRLRLYKRLQSKTSGGLTTDLRQQTLSNSRRDSSLRRNSTQTDESTPPSSSCSDETTTTSNTDTITNSSAKNSLNAELANKFDKCNLSKPTDEFTFRGCQSLKSDPNDLVDEKEASTGHKVDSKTPNLSKGDKEIEKIDLELAFDHNYEVILPTTSKNQQKADIPFRTPSRIPAINNVYRTINNNDHGSQQQQRSLANEVNTGSVADSHTAPDGYRNCPANNDLERIEEGEEDDIDYYCNSERFRSIYEEKISPMIQERKDRQQQQNQTKAFIAREQAAKLSRPPIRLKDDENQSMYSSPKSSQDNRFNINNINSAKRGNRPPIIYLPRPDEDIDLIETIQSLGHDLDILASDLKVTSTSAQGYLYKSCSNNSKKWLKRYFHFNRETKILSYYESKEQLVKKVNTPKCAISFEEISDVYVDHRLSEKQKGTTRKSYVFVLATIKRKYLLASSKAETMRAWIDILFTAAKANDYFQQIQDNEENLSFNYDSFKED